MNSRAGVIQKGTYEAPVSNPGPQAPDLRLSRFRSVGKKEYEPCGFRVGDTLYEILD